MSSFMHPLLVPNFGDISGRPSSLSYCATTPLVVVLLLEE